MDTTEPGRSDEWYEATLDPVETLSSEPPGVTPVFLYDL